MNETIPMDTSIAVPTESLAVVPPVLSEAPAWWQELEEGFDERDHFFLLHLNVNDFVVDEGQPLRLERFVCERLARQGCDMIVTYCRSAGYDLFDTYDDRRRTQEQRRDFARLSGLRAPEPLWTAGENSEVIEQHRDLPPTDVLLGLERLLSQQVKRVAVVITFAEHIVPADPNIAASLGRDAVVLKEMLQRCANSDAIRATDNLVVLLTAERSAIHADLLRADSGCHVIKVDLPNEESKRGYIEVMDRLGLASLSPEMDKDLLSKVTTGLRLRDIDALFRRAQAQGQPLTYAHVRERKALNINALCHGLLEFIEPSFGFEAVGGNERLKDELEAIARACRLDPQSDDVPRGGILLSGPPGTGKTHLALAFANASQMNFVRTKNVSSMWYGESERNLELLYDVLPSLQPVVLFMDEVDQLMPGRGSGADHEVTSKMRARTLSFLGDEAMRGKVMVFASTNRPDLLDVALPRRFGRVFPVLLPNAEEREAILATVIRNLGGQYASDANLRQFATLHPHLTADNLRTVVQRALQLARHDGGKGALVGQRHLGGAFDDFVPNEDPDNQALMSLLAVSMTNFHTALPWGVDDAYEPEHLPTCMEGLADERGRVIPEALNQRIHDLESRIAMKRQRARGW